MTSISKNTLNIETYELRDLTIENKLKERFRNFTVLIWYLLVLALWSTWLYFSGLLSYYLAKYYPCHNKIIWQEIIGTKNYQQHKEDQQTRTIVSHGRQVYTCQDTSHQATILSSFILILRQSCFLGRWR